MNIITWAFAIFSTLCLFNLVESTQVFDLRKVVPAAAFTTKVPCNKCEFPGQTPTLTPRPRPSPQGNPCDTCRIFIRRQTLHGVDISQAKGVCALCAFHKLDESEKVSRLQTSVKQPGNLYEIFFIAVDKVRQISPTVTYEGSTGGAGCSAIEIAFGVPGCIVTQFSGTALQPRLLQSSGTFANFLAFQVRKGTKKVRMTVPKHGDCGRREGGNWCTDKAKDFYLDAVTTNSQAPGCNIMDYQKKVTTFLWFCGWRDCADTKFSVRLYTDFTNFKRVTMTGSYVSTCSVASGNQLFVY